MGRGANESIRSGVATGEAESLQGNLGLRNKDAATVAASSTAVHRGWSAMRPSEVVTLLNSTQIGEVLSTRQLYRHRQLAPQVGRNGAKRVDLLVYMAWLFWERRSAPPLRGRKRRTAEIGDTLGVEDLRLMLRQQEYRCALTGSDLTPDNFALDHITPIVDGGDFSVENSQLVLKTVNRAKHTMSQTDFIEMCHQVASHAEAVSTN